MKFWKHKLPTYQILVLLCCERTVITYYFSILEFSEKREISSISFSNFKPKLHYKSERFQKRALTLIKNYFSLTLYTALSSYKVQIRNLQNEF